MHSIFTQAPLNMMSMGFPQEEGVLDLRVPEKQRMHSLDYTVPFPIPRASRVYGSFPEYPRNDNSGINTASCPGSNMTATNNRSPPLSSPITISPGCESPNSTISSSDSLLINLSPRSGSKPNRPFKSLTKDPFLNMKTTVNLLHEDVDYATFREQMLSQTRLDYSSTNMNMRRKTAHNENNTDPTYWEKRKKNNEAAKKSRDARKAREDEIAIRCAFLEQENLKLKLKIAAVQSDTERLQNLYYRL